MELDTDQKTEQARELCEKGLWPQVLAFAQEWHAENPAEARAFFLSRRSARGVGPVRRGGRLV